MGARGKKNFTIGLMPLVGVVFYTAVSIYGYNSNLEAESADAAIVPGAAVFGDQPSPVFRERINHSITLYEAGTVEWLIFTGGHDGDGRAAESLAAKAYAIDQGIPESAILTETESQITWENLVNAQKIASEYGLTTFIIVSDPLHMKRSMLMAEDLGMEAYSSPTPTTRYQSWNTQMRFLARETFFYLLYWIQRPFI